MMQAKSLVCMNRVFQAIGEYKAISSTGPDLPSGRKSVQCLAACEDQTNDVQISYSVLPNREGQIFNLIEYGDNLINI